ncbi:phosphotransferase [Alicyclobacillus shizuokensis]|uniref:phosphotransferase n=1 Tax=Alicyclobacillus shizuokensis TaxID=392014 RepID=UPI00082CF5FB|nr:phosphotransferase [Alicyclobacillus shizuokensis]MCL6626211.1 phosphotransferase [Alicyclobacillus shizuokensis]
MMRRRQNMPPWAKALLQQLLKPPYFLEQIAAAGKGQGHSPPHTHDTPHSGAPEEKAAGEPPGGSPLGDARRRAPAHRARTPWHSASPSVTGQAPASRNPTHTRSPEAPSAETGAESVVTATLSDAALGKPSWQAILRQQGIPASLVKAYGWRVQRMEAVGSVARVVTESRTYAVKRTHLSPEQIRFIHELANHVRIHGFPSVPRFALTKKPRRPYYSHGGRQYYATRWVVGNPSNFGRIEQVAAVARALARFHESSRGFEPASGIPVRNEFALEEMYRRRVGDLRVLLVEAENRSGQDRFAKRLCDLAPALRADGEKALNLLTAPEVRAHLFREEEDPCVCHLDAVPDNFLYTPEHEAYVIDLDLAAYAPRALDIAHLLRRSLERQQWAGEVAYRCFVEFDRVRTLEKAEYTLIQALLTFPYRAWRLAHSHFRLGARAQETAELEDYANQESLRQPFLTSLAEQIQQL